MKDNSISMSFSKVTQLSVDKDVAGPVMCNGARTRLRFCSIRYKLYRKVIIKFAFKELCYKWLRSYVNNGVYSNFH